MNDNCTSNNISCDNSHTSNFNKHDNNISSNSNVSDAIKNCSNQSNNDTYNVTSCAASCSGVNNDISSGDIISNCVVSDNTTDITDNGNDNGNSNSSNVNNCKNDKNIAIIRSWLLSGRFDILLITETKIDASFSNGQFNVDGLRMHRVDRDIHGGGLMIFIRNDICFHVMTRFNMDLSIFRTESMILKVKINRSWFVLAGI